MSKEATFSLRYTHSAPDQVEAGELIKVLSAFNRIALKASSTVYGSGANTSFRLTHVHSGSIDIQGFIELLGGVQAILPSIVDIKDIPELIKGWLDLLSFLKGKPAQRIQTVQKGNAVQIENAHGNVTNINGNVYNSFVINNIGTDASKLEVPIKKGARELELFSGRKRIASYSPDDVAQFRSIKPTENPINSEIDAIVEVVAPVFQGQGMWRFRYGRMFLTAKLLDDEYRERVEGGQESFRRGDLLKVRLRTEQERIGGRVATRHFIVKVLERIAPDASAA
jgi:hypothetical protein